MSEEQQSDARKTPWQFWAISGAALLWNGMGALDYVMTQTRNASYMSGFSPEQIEFFYGIPSWAVAAWAIAVWGGVLGALLLMARRSLAVWAFLVSLVAVVITTFQNYVLSNAMEVSGDAGSLIFAALIFLIAVGLYLYASAMSKQNILT